MLNLLEKTKVGVLSGGDVGQAGVSGHLHQPHGRSEVRARRHLIPQLVELAVQVSLELFDRLSVDPWRTLPLFHLLPGVPVILTGSGATHRLPRTTAVKLYK